jgi:hypothetical protein
MPPAPTADFTRPALAPGIIAVIVLMVGLALLDSDAFLIIRFVVCIFALILAWFAVQARQWWWLGGLIPIAVLWNPVFVIELHGQGWVSGQFIAALVMLTAGVLIKVRPSKP